jgi:mRNA-degrading endonuclease RelE of RelBE toxin-antitoxin system
MSSAFSKDIVHIDRKLQGRILEALVEITENPTEVRGDTVKPLTADLKGCWRYRVGDYRIIYSPNKSTGDITLLAFDARGSAYAA